MIRIQKNWPFAYQNVREKLRELTPHLERNNLVVPDPLGEYIDLQLTPQQLANCIELLRGYVEPMKGGENVEQKITGVLLEKFISDAKRFKDDLELSGEQFVPDNDVVDM